MQFVITEISFTLLNFSLSLLPLSSVSVCVWVLYGYVNTSLWVSLHMYVYVCMPFSIAPHLVKQCFFILFIYSLRMSYNLFFIMFFPVP